MSSTISNIQCNVLLFTYSKETVFSNPDNWSFTVTVLPSLKYSFPIIHGHLATLV